MTVSLFLSGTPVSACPGSACLPGCLWTRSGWRPCCSSRAGWWCTSACPCCWLLWWRRWCCWTGWSTCRRTVSRRTQTVIRPSFPLAVLKPRLSAGVDSRLVPLFDPNFSPRNFVLVALKARGWEEKSPTTFVTLSEVYKESGSCFYNTRNRTSYCSLSLSVCF